VGKRVWVVTGFEHPEANLYHVAAESPCIIWDEVTVDVEVDSGMFGAMKVKAKVKYAYDGASVTGATTFVNGKLCDETEPGVYEAEISSWSPLEQLTVQANSEDLPEETWTISAFHLMNTVLYLVIVVAVVVVLFLFLKRRRSSLNQPIEEIKEETVFSI
jgi:hypothetical protein